VRYKFLYWIIFTLVPVCGAWAETAENYLTPDSPVYLFDGPEFINAVGYVSSKSILSVCEVTSNYYRLCPFGGRPSYFLKAKYNLAKAPKNETPRLARIFAFEDYFDVLYSDSADPPGYLIDNSSDKLKIIFSPIISRLEYIRYEKGWKGGNINVLPLENSAISIEVEGSAACGVRIENIERAVLRVHLNDCFKQELNVAIDPGHGGSDTGSCQNKVCEADLSLQLAEKLRDSLTKKGIKSFLTREGNNTVSLEERAALALKNKSTLFLSIHFDNWEPSFYIKKPPSGTGCYYFNQFLSGAAKFFCKEPGIKGLPISHVTQRSLFVLLPYDYPSLLVEVGNFAHKADASRMLQPEFMSDAAEFLSNRISEFNLIQTGANKR
jgi:N-acetylmuramoyl-L-alanine amidase